MRLCSIHCQAQKLCKAIVNHTRVLLTQHADFEVYEGHSHVLVVIEPLRPPVRCCARKMRSPLYWPAVREGIAGGLNITMTTSAKTTLGTVQQVIIAKASISTYCSIKLALPFSSVVIPDQLCLFAHLDS